MNRAFSTFVTRAVNEDARSIEGVATTPSTDHMGDIVEPLGAEFSMPMPLLWQHRSELPVGHVTWAKATKSGIEFRATVAKSDKPGALQDRLNEAWESVKLKLVRAVSIGFKPLETSRLDNGGLRFLKWKWFELSLVTLPANEEATITAIKAALGRSRYIHIPGVSGLPIPVPGDSGVIKPQVKGNVMKSFAERAAEISAIIAPKEARMKSIMSVALEDGDRDLTESEAEEFDVLTGEVKELRVKFNRFTALDGSAATAKPVTAVADSQVAATLRGGGNNTVYPVAATQEEKGLGFARLVSTYALANGDPIRASQIVKNRYPNMSRSQMGQIQTVLRSQVEGGTTTDTSWAAPLVEPTNLIAEFVEYLRPMTIVGRFGVGNIPSLRRIPFNVKFPAQTTGGAGYWTGEGKAKPLTRFDFTSTTLRFCKVANIAVLSEDLIRLSSPSAELVVRNALGEALAARMDADFVNPAITEIADVRPAAITNGATAYVTTGVDAAAVRTDIKALLAYFIANDIPTTTVVFIMRTAQALNLSLMRNALGGREFPDITMNGGVLEGFPVIASQYVPSGVVVAAAASEVYFSDDGGVSVALSREASLEMDDSPSSASSDSPSVEATMVSMFQTNSVALRAERHLNWKRRRAAAVTYLTGVGWGGDDTSPITAI